LSLNRILSIVVAAVAVAAAVSVSLVAAAFALYALVVQWLGPIGGAALVAGVFALIALFSAAVAVGKIRPRRGVPAPPPSPAEKIMGIARERPILATGAAVLAGIVLMRNPAIATALVSAFLAGGGAKPPSPPKRR